MEYTRKQIDSIVSECEQYRKSLVTNCMSIYNYNEALAQDCVQDAYLELFNALSKGTEIRNYKAWLYKVALRKQSNSLKEIAKRKEVSLLEAKDTIDDSGQGQDIDFDDTGGAITPTEVVTLCMKILRCLSLEERALYSDIYIRQKSLREIATETGKSIAAVKKRHERLKKKIRKEVKKFASS